MNTQKETAKQQSKTQKKTKSNKKQTNSLQQHPKVNIETQSQIFSIREEHADTRILRVLCYLNPSPDSSVNPPLGNTKTRRTTRKPKSKTSSTILHLFFVSPQNSNSSFNHGILENSTSQTGITRRCRLRTNFLYSKNSLSRRWRSFPSPHRLTFLSSSFTYATAANTLSTSRVIFDSPRMHNVSAAYVGCWIVFLFLFTNNGQQTATAPRDLTRTTWRWEFVLHCVQFFSFFCYSTYEMRHLLTRVNSEMKNWSLVWISGFFVFCVLSCKESFGRVVWVGLSTHQSFQLYGTFHSCEMSSSFFFHTDGFGSDWPETLRCRKEIQTPSDYLVTHSSGRLSLYFYLVCYFPYMISWYVSVAKIFILYSLA